MHPTQHLVGVSAQQRLTLIAGTLSALGQLHVSTLTIERLVGKRGFCHSYRTCVRSVSESV